MEGVHGTHKGSKLASEDIISSMPESLLTNIMNRLPIRDAVRTSILAQNWRLKWTLLTQLVFDTEISESLVKGGRKGKEYYDSRIVSSLLLVLKGPVTKFVLYIRSDRILDSEDINNWVLFLYRKGIKELTLVSTYKKPLKLPIHLFSCMELTHLKLVNCLLHSSPIFCGFPNLLSLHLCAVRFGSHKVGKFITRCPSLETMKIVSDYRRNHRSKINLDDIAKLGNLKKLTFSLLELENSVITSSKIFQFLGFLPKLQELELDFQRCEVVAEAVTRKWVPTAFPCLNTLTLSGVKFGSGRMLSCVFDMIWGSPNLQELRIVMSEYIDVDEFDVPPTKPFSSDLGSNKVGKLQLVNVVIEHFSGLKNEKCLMKYLLACSPFLNRVVVHSDSSLESDEQLRAAVKLLKLHRASSVAQVDFY